jgi:uncharacterized protein YbjQ (UPF0145 family)
MLDGYTIKEYKGLVFGEVINGANFVKDFSASITNFIGGRSGAYESEVINARTNALNEMAIRAQNMGANAVVGVRVDTETIANSMIMVTASGTAVVI